jgi:pyrroloquinoline quinone biosynthesis protein D
MADVIKRQRTMISPASKPRLPRHIKLRHDAGRGRWIILAPERVFEPDETAVEVLKLCDGAKDVASITAELAKQYNAPESEIGGDVIQMLQDLADRGVVEA